MWIERSNPVILREIGQRMKANRLQQNITQRKLAEDTGVSLNVIQRLEAGKAISTSNLIAVIRGIRMLEQLEVAFPEPEISPILLQKLKGKERKRARE